MLDLSFQTNVTLSYKIISNFSFRLYKKVFLQNINTIFVWIDKTPSVSYADSSLKEGAIKAFLFEEGGMP